MRFVQFDYHPAPDPNAHDKLATYWSAHWHGRKDWKTDMSREPVWETIYDVLDKPGLLLEAGCGRGQWVDFFESRGYTTVGTDYAYSALRDGKEHSPAIRVMGGDLRRLPFKDAQFDYIFSGGAVEHDIGGPERGLREMCRVLKRSGVLMCSVPCLNAQRILLFPWLVLRDWLKRRKFLRRLAGKTDPFEFFEYMYAPWTYRKILSQCGFEVLALRPYAWSGNGPRWSARLGAVAGGSCAFSVRT